MCLMAVYQYLCIDSRTRGLVAARDGVAEEGLLAKGKGGLKPALTETYETMLGEQCAPAAHNA